MRRSLIVTLLSLFVVAPSNAQMPGMMGGPGGMMGHQNQQKKEEEPAKPEYKSILREVETGEYRNIKAEQEDKTLFEYAKDGDEDGVNQVLASGFDVNSQDELGNTAFHYAAAEGKMNIIKMLTVFQAKYDLPNAQGITPLYMALANEQFVAADTLHTRGAKVNRDDADGTPLVFHLVKQGDPHEAVKWLDERKLNFFKKNAEGETLVSATRKNEDAKTTLTYVENAFKKAIRAYYKKRGKEVPKGALDF